MKKHYVIIGTILIIAILSVGLYIKKVQTSQPLDTIASVTEYVQSPSPVGSKTLGVFEGRTPCQEFLEMFAKFTVKSDGGCQRIKWVITFYQDEKTGNPSRYIFGIHGREESHSGNWTIKKGTLVDPNAIVYQLSPDHKRQTIALLKVGDDHLFFLDENMNLLIGNKNLSYTLSKTADSYETRKSPLTPTEIQKKP